MFCIAARSVPSGVHATFELPGPSRQTVSLVRGSGTVSGEKDGRRVPVILFTKGAGPLLADLAETGADALGVDWTTSLAEARNYTNGKVALQGNLDPATLRESPEAIRQGVADTLASYGKGTGHVFNLGHGILVDTPTDNAKRVVDTVHAWKKS